MGCFRFGDSSPVGDCVRSIRSASTATAAQSAADQLGTLMTPAEMVIASAAAGVAAMLGNVRGGDGGAAPSVPPRGRCTSARFLAEVAYQPPEVPVMATDRCHRRARAAQPASRQAEPAVPPRTLLRADRGARKSPREEVTPDDGLLSVLAATRLPCDTEDSDARTRELARASSGTGRSDPSRRTQSGTEIRVRRETAPSPTAARRLAAVA
jgi:hypothetical protein